MTFLVGGLSVGVFYLLVKNLISRKYGQWAAILFLVNPLMVTTFFSNLNESLAILLGLALLLWSCRFIKMNKAHEQLRYAVLTGLALGYMISININYISFALVWFYAIIYHLLMGQGKLEIRLLRIFLSVFIGVAIIYILGQSFSGLSISFGNQPWENTLVFWNNLLVDGFGINPLGGSSLSLILTGLYLVALILGVVRVADIFDKLIEVDVSKLFLVLLWALASWLQNLMEPNQISMTVPLLIMIFTSFYRSVFVKKRFFGRYNNSALVYFAAIVICTWLISYSLLGNVC